MGEQQLEFVAAGDAMITRRLGKKHDRKFDRLVDHIQKADASLINLEVLLHDFEFPPAAHGPGTYMHAPPWVADELTEIGFDAFAAATNHSFDYGTGGMRSTMAALEEREIPYAGLGRNLTEARSPTYFDASGGRIALLSANATVTTGSEAGPASRGMKGRPGISALGHQAIYRVPTDAYETFETISENLGLETFKQHISDLGFPVDEPDEGFTFFVVDGDTHPTIKEGKEYQVERVAEESDVEAILRQIREARRQADWVIMSLHYHEGAGAGGTDQTVPTFVEKFAKDAIDAGADVFLGHGSHCLRGIEIYDGAPIFYSLGNFIAQNDLVVRLPQEMYDRYDLGSDATPADVFEARATREDGTKRSFEAYREYYETVLPICSFDDDGLTDMTLHPVDLGRERDRPQKGHPRLATGETVTEIFQRVESLSKPYGTSLEIGDMEATVQW